MTGTSFVYYWITFAVMVPVFSALVFLLARKAGYLKNQDRLRHLALWAEVPEEENLLNHGSRLCRGTQMDRDNKTENI